MTLKSHPRVRAGPGYSLLQSSTLSRKAQLPTRIRPELRTYDPLSEAFVAARAQRYFESTMYALLEREGEEFLRQGHTAVREL